MKTIVTGGTGFIGRHLVAALKERGEDVRVIDLLDPTQACDVRKPETFGTDLWGAEVVYHLAALPRVQYSIEHPAETAAINVLGTINVLESARLAGVRRVVFASSSSVYGEPVEMPLRETMALNPLSPYAHQKASAEWYCRLYAEHKGIETVCLRFFNVYGPGADPSGAYALVVAKFIDQRMRGGAMTITGDGTQTRDFTHVDDVVRAMLLAADSPIVGAGEAINIGGGRKVSVNEVAALIGGPTINIEPRLEPHDTLADISKAKELLGWEPTKTFEEGIAELKLLHALS